MADPIVVKVSALGELTAMATDDLLTVVDVSEAQVQDKTKKIKAGNLKIFNANQLQANTVPLSSFTADARVAIRNLVYMQLFPATEVIATTTGKAFFFVPSHLAGMYIKKAGLGVVTPGGAGNTTVALGALTSVAGDGFTEGADINVQLPATGTKISVNVTAGGGSPKGLDFWFVVG